jgi:hypothetical protein
MNEILLGVEPSEVFRPESIDRTIRRENTGQRSVSTRFASFVSLYAPSPFAGLDRNGAAPLRPDGPLVLSVLGFVLGQMAFEFHAPVAFVSSAERFLSHVELR